ncbi:hypothetical protein BDY24DRAFT_380871 [Mrakia frigida]|uniref:uncharacterized protein n=1 Tax=Mrakia frigida TaxID=29902 RepID=UPI003FCC18C5
MSSERRTASTFVLVSGMLITGAANSLLTKLQDMQCVENCSNPDPTKRLAFEQPVFQSLNMFAGEMLCLLPLLYTHLFSSPSTSPFSAPQPSRAKRFFHKITGKQQNSSAGYEPIGTSSDDGNDDDSGVDMSRGEFGHEGGTLKGWKLLLFWFPAVCDICGTTLMNYGLILTPVSLYQMTRGSLVLFVGALSVIFLRRRLFLYQWLSLVGVMIGVALVGLSGALKPSSEKGLQVPEAPESEGQIFLGILLIMFAQLFTATQFVVEEKVMGTHSVEPLLAVGLEGTFGLLTTAFAMPILHYFFAAKSSYFDVYRLYHQVFETPLVWQLSLAIMLSISSFNYFGLSVTRVLSATARSTIDTCRTCLIWAASLFLGWEHILFPSSFVQLSGFSLLVWFTLIFNGIVSPPYFKPAIELREEDLRASLDETAILPSEGTVGRVGYEVLPRLEEGRGD